MGEDVISFAIPIASAARLSQAQKQHISAHSDNIIREVSFTELTPFAAEIRLTDAPKNIAELRINLMEEAAYKIPHPRFKEGRLAKYRKRNIPARIANLITDVVFSGSPPVAMEVRLTEAKTKYRRSPY